MAIFSLLGLHQGRVDAPQIHLVRGKTLQGADGQGLVHFLAPALGFARMGADPPQDSRAAAAGP